MSSTHTLLRPTWACITAICTLALFFALPAGAAQSPSAMKPAAFPVAKAESVGIPSAALSALNNRVQVLVDDQEIVGGELLVIKRGHTILRKAYGWKDRDAGTRMPVDAVYCVRSMTKPLVGTAIQMLIDDGRLHMDTPMHTILPAFERAQMRHITVENLLEHTAGFSLTTMRKPLTAYADLGDIAAEAAQSELLFDPGHGFQYSDASADVLGAMVEAITHKPLQQFIQQRILDPLSMRDTYTLLGDNAAVKQRIPAAYSGGTGAWQKHWDPSDPPIFPLFLGSQSLYSTTTDYAKFLALWMHGGTLGGRAMMSPETITRALQPRHRLTDPTNGLANYYGQLWMIRAKTEEHGGTKRVMFGHDGSDGTHAWAWPEQDLMVLFFTQSRGTLAGIGIEKSVEDLLVAQQPHPVDSAPAATPATDVQALAGLYWDQDVANAYYIVTPRGDNIMLDRPGAMHLLFKPDEARQRFVAEASPRVWIAFDRDSDGAVTTMRTFFGKRVEKDPRHAPATGLPTLAQVIAMVGKAHHIKRLAQLGVVRLSGTINYVDRKMKGSIRTTFDTRRNRSDVNIGSSRQAAMTDGVRAWSVNTATGVNELEGRPRQQVLLDRLPVLLGDWRQHFRQLQVLKRIKVGDRSMILVRAVPRLGTGMSLYIDANSGQLLRTDSLVQIPGIGIVGVRTMMDDYQDVGGMQIPFHTRSRFAHPLIGLVETRLRKAETHVAIKPDTFIPASASPAGARK
ncbi:MAG: serine hydrolase domain-containing protein [Rhodanobacteraceae bacterium]